MLKYKPLIISIFLCISFILSSGHAQGEKDITDLGGQITAQYYDSPSGEEISKVIDNSIYTKYLTFHSSGWIQFKANSEAFVSKYTITSANDSPERDPKNWTFKGSNNGLNWTTLDTRSNEDFPNRFQKRDFLFSNSIGFVFYRLEMVNNGGGILQLAEWELWASSGGGPGTPPAPPSNLTALATSGSQINLSWFDNSINEEGFKIERSRDGINWAWSTNVGANRTSYFSTDLLALTTYYYRVRAENSYGNSGFSNTAGATTTSNIPPSTWKEHWFEHDQLLTRVYYNDDVAIYYDNDMDPSVTWPYDFMTDVWRHTKSVYGNYGGENRLYAIFHQDKYSGGHPSTYFDASHDYRNVIDCGPGPWHNATGWNIDVLTHEVAHIVEGASNGIHKSPAFGLWRDSKWAEIYIYDVYKGIGWNYEAERWYNNCINTTNDFPRNNTYWFRNWFYPIYRDYGGSAVLAGFFKLLAQYFPKNGDDYARDMNWGEFVHFWNGAAGVNLKHIATTAFGWPADWEGQFTQAQIDFPHVLYDVDWIDLKMFLEHWLEVDQPDCEADLNGDCKICFLDFAILAKKWLE